jgi:hypothetical protein
LPTHRAGQRYGSRFSSQCFFIDLAEGRRTLDDLPFKLSVPFENEIQAEEVTPKQMAAVAS